MGALKTKYTEIQVEQKFLATNDHCATQINKVFTDHIYI